MSTLNKFIVYQCDTCNRKTEIQLDPKRPDPINCNITLKCRGKLKRVGESSAKHFLFTPMVNDLQDFIPRGSETSTIKRPNESKEVSLFTGPNILTISGLRKVQGASTNIFTILELNGGDIVAEDQPLSIKAPLKSKLSLILYEISPKILQFKKFTFLKQNTVYQVKGTDNSPEANSLRFNQQNRIQVFVNGVKLNESEYDSSIDNVVTFTPSIYSSTNLIEVLVFNDLSQDIDSSSEVRLSFLSKDKNIATDLGCLEDCCWGNSQSVIIDNVETYNLYCNDLSSLKYNVSYGISRIELTDEYKGIRTVNPSQVKLLLGNNPYAFEDKELFGYVRGDVLTDSTVSISFKPSKLSGKLELLINSTHISQTLQQIIPLNLINISSTAITGSSDSKVIDHQFIIGPV